MLRIPNYTFSKLISISPYTIETVNSSIKNYTRINALLKEKTYYFLYAKDFDNANLVCVREDIEYINLGFKSHNFYGKLVFKNEIKNLYLEETFCYVLDSSNLSNFYTIQRYNVLLRNTRINHEIKWENIKGDNFNAISKDAPPEIKDLYSSLV
jgi:hypothetical protein